MSGKTRGSIASGLSTVELRKRNLRYIFLTKKFFVNANPLQLVNLYKAQLKVHIRNGGLKTNFF